MATEHLDQIKDTRPPVAATLKLRDDLRDLAGRVADPERPYLTLTLDYIPEGTRPNVRPALLWLKDQEQRLGEELGPRGPAFDALTEGMCQVHEALDALEGEPPKGFVFVAQPATGYFLNLPLSVETENSVAVAPTPILTPLARLAENHEPFAVLLADSRQAFLHVFSLGTHIREVAMKNGQPHLQPQAVGNRMSERPANNAYEQEQENYAKAIAEETRRVLDEEGVRRLVVAAEDQLTSTLLDHFPKELRGKVIGTTAADIRSTPSDLRELAKPMMVQAELAEEDDAIQRLTTAALSSGGLGVFGAEETLAALEAGQVQTLVIADDFHAPGWADDVMGVAGVGDVPKEHPAGGDVKNLRPVDLADEMIHLAIATADGFQIVTTSGVPVSEGSNEAETTRGQRQGPAQTLTEHGGVGAILRFRLDQDQAVPDLQ